MNHAPALILTTEERNRLENLLSDRNSTNGLKRRSRAILACSEGKTNLEVASEVGATNLSVGRWRRQFLERRLDAVEQEHRGRPVPEVSLTQKEQLVLEKWIRSQEACPRLAKNAAIVLACASGKGNVAVARQLGVLKERVGQLRHQFLAHRVRGLRRESAAVTPQRPNTKPQIMASRTLDSSSRILD